MSENKKNQHLIGDGNLGFWITISNKTNSILSLQSSSCDSGNFSTSPPSTIQPGETTTVNGNGTNGTATGVTPVWTYGIEGTDASITWNIDIPFAGAGSGNVYVNSGTLTNLVVSTSPDFVPHCDNWDATTVISMD